MYIALSSTNLFIFSAISNTDFDFTKYPFSPSRTISTVPPTFVATIGIPCENASIGVNGNPSVNEVKTTISNWVIIFIISSLYPKNLTYSYTPIFCAAFLSFSLSSPSPMIKNNASG